MALTRIDSFFLDLDAIGGITFDDQAGTPTLRVDATTHRVGIGTSAPASLLDVAGDVTIADKIIHSGDTNTAIRFPAADTFTVETDGSERLRVDSSGRVGIGTTTPGASLHVVGDVFSPTAFRIGSSTSSLSGQVVNESDISKSITLSADPGNVGASTFLGFAVDGSERARIDSFGRLLVGASAAIGGELFSVAGTSLSRDQALAPNNSGTTTGTSSIGFEPVYLGASGRTGVARIDFVRPSTSDGNYDGYISFFTRANGQAIGERLRITQAGNVGIGTTNPQALLHLVTAGAQVRWDNTAANDARHEYYRAGVRQAYINWDENNFNFAATQSGGVITFATGGITEKVRINSSGNVGIGTTNPQDILHVNGTSRFFGNRSAIFNGATGTYTTWMDNGTPVGDIGTGGTISTGAPNSDFGIGSRGTGSVFIATGASPIRRLVINDSGSVGIGTTNPAYNVHVQGSADQTLSLDRSADQVGNVGSIIYRMASQEVASIQAERVTVGGRGTSLKFSTAQNTTGTLTERLRLDSAGIVTIGNPPGNYSSYDAPRLFVTVESATDASFVSISDRSLGQANPSLNFHRRTGVTINQSYGYRLSMRLTDLAFEVSPGALPGSHSWSEVVRFSSTGNVGIATTNPLSRLHVNGNILTQLSNAAPYIVSRGDYSDNTVYTFYNNDTTGITNPSAGAMGFRNGGVYSLYLTSANNAGIGTTNPASKLHVHTTTDNDGLDVSIQTTPFGGEGPSITFRHNTNNGTQQDFARIKSRMRSGNDSVWNSDLSFYVGGNSLFEALTIKPDGNVGIGTTSISALGTGIITLDIRGSTANRSGGIKLTRGDNSPALGLYHADTFNVLYNYGTYPFLLYTNDVERLRVTSTGNVGIGATNPQAKLHIDTGGSDANDFRFHNEEVGLFIGNWGTGSDYPRTITINGSRYDTGTHPKLRIAGQGGIEFAVDLNSVRAVINSSGDVGIGVTEPQSRLHVENIIGNSTTYLTISQNRAYLVGSINERAGINLCIREGGYTALDRIFARIDSTTESDSTSANGYLALHTRTGGSIIEKVRINSSGNVGIGTTNPDCKLAIQSGNLRIAAGYTRMISGYKGDNASSFVMFDITGIQREDFTEIVIKHGHEGGGMHGSYRRWVFTSNVSNVTQTFEDTGNVNYGGGNGFSFSWPTYGTLRITWGGATSFATGFYMNCWVRSRTNIGFTNQGMDQFYA